jgi:hypothetical protein
MISARESTTILHVRISSLPPGNRVLPIQSPCLPGLIVLNQIALLRIRL